MKKKEMTTKRDLADAITEKHLLEHETVNQD